MFLGKKKMILPVHFCDSLSAFRLFVNQFLTYGEGVSLGGDKKNMVSNRRMEKVPQYKNMEYLEYFKVNL